MAKIKLGALAQDVRGSIAGNTFARNKGGSYVRQKSSPTQPRTVRQVEQRAILANASGLWKGLTEELRNAWNVYAANNPITNVFGDAILLSGHGAFVQVMALRATIGLAASTTPPVSGGLVPAAVEAGTLVADVSDGALTVTTAAQVATSGGYMFWATRGMSAGRASVESDYRYAGYVPVEAAAVGAQVIPLDMNPLLGFVAGQKVSVYVDRIDSNGLIIDSTKLQVIATA
jgi:hypothetical protein